MRAASASAWPLSASSPLPGSSGTLVAFGQLARRVLQTKGAHLFRRRPDEGDAGLLRSASAKSAFSLRKP